MRYKTLFKSGLLVLTFLILLVSCDKDFNEIGANIIGDDHFGFELYDGATVNAFNLATSSVQSNNLPLNSLGIYNNPVFGKTKAGFVTQLQMATPNPTFDPAYFVSMDSVVLSVPYFSHVTSTDGSGSKYALDSINGSGAINLKIFESGYYLNDYDPSTNFQDYQSYFTSQEGVFNSHKIGEPLNNGSANENTAFQPNAKEVIVYKVGDDLQMIKDDSHIDKRLSPRMLLHLDTLFFKTKILNAPAGKLLNNSVFKDYFKGLYFQVADANDGTLMRLDFSKGDITIYYKQWEDSTKKKKVRKTFVLNLQGNTVNLVEHDPLNTNYASISVPRPLDPLPNDSRLYVKGGAGGSAAIIDLFGSKDLYGYEIAKDEKTKKDIYIDGYLMYTKTDKPNGVPDELDDLRYPKDGDYYSERNKFLVNEANLTFYIDQNAMKNLPNDPNDDSDGKSERGEPQRVFLFDVNNNTPLYDFVTDNTTSSNTKLNKSILGGTIETQNKRGVRYKVRLTNHIRNLVKNTDSTNVRLGLVVTEVIGLTGNSKLQTPVNIPYPVKSKNSGAFDRIPSASVMNPLGTVLYGSVNDPVNPFSEKNRLKLEIYYTKPKK